MNPETTGLEVAVIGIACRFPGAPDKDAFWRNLRDGVCSIEGTAGRPAAGPVGEARSVEARGAIADPEAFDAGFFGYSPREARLLDPQFRLLHECAWTCLEDAGIDPTRGDGAIGLYAGAADNTYWNVLSLLNRGGQEAEQFAAEQLCNRDFLCTLIAHKLDLRGPAVVIQSACSTSLTAVHSACRALLTGECRVALAGGVTVVYPRERGYRYAEGMIFSPSGVCRAFDAGADGTVPGEGVGLVALKPLKRALADGDAIYAVIKASAANNDGRRKPGYTAPSLEGQAEAIRTALRLARTPAATIGYVEAHGTGTPLGDPVEIAALSRAFATPERGFCRIGSVKTNIGHLDTAAGVAGLIKAVLALYHGYIPKSLHFRTPNPAAELARSPFRVAAEGLVWAPSAAAPRRAAVSSFGIGGTNVHVVLEEAPAPAPVEHTGAAQLFVLSARSPGALERLAAGLAAAARTLAPESLAAAAVTLQTGRARFEHGLAVTAASPLELAAALAAGDVARGVRPETAPALVLMFSGQGSQYPGMGRELYRQEPRFRAALDQCLDGLAPYAVEGMDWRQVLFAGPGAAAAAVLRRTEIAQPLLFAVEYALARLLLSWLPAPAALLGHSLGEYTAACIAGVFALEDALRLVALRGRLMGRCPPGAMLAVDAGRETVTPLLGGGCELAAVNGHSQVVVSGPCEALAELEAGLGRHGMRGTRLNTSHAFHSALMDPAASAYAEALAEALPASAPKPPQIPVLSNLTGRPLTLEEVSDPGYWARQLRETVQFAAGLDALLEEGQPLLLEVGPGSALATLARRHGAVRVASSMRQPLQEQDDRRVLLDALGTLWLNGLPIDWPALHGQVPPRKLPLPTYPFERERYHLEGDPLRLLAERGPDRPGGAAVTRTAAPAGLFYRLSWRRRQRLSKPGPGKPDGLVLCAEGPLGNALAQVFDQVRLVRRGGSGWEALLATGPDAMPGQVLFCLAAEPGERDGIEDYRMLAELARTMSGHPRWQSVGLCVVTAGAFQVTGTETLYPERALLGGLARAVQAEGGLPCRLLDLDPGADPAALAGALGAVGAAPDSPWIAAVRGGFLWEPAFEPVTPVAATPPLREGGVYLIAGGLGGIGLTLARGLFETCRARLILVGRHRREPDGLAALAGAELLVETADVGDLEQMRRVFAAARARFGPVHGVVHAAGSAESRLLAGADAGFAERILGPKVRGTRVLAQLLEEQETPGDFLALMSSLDAWVPGPGQTAYAAANAFLDAYAAQREGGAGTRVVSIGWDTWRSVGMAARAAAPAPEALDPAEGEAAFRQILAAGWADVVVTKTPWPERLARWERDSRAGAARAEPAAGSADGQPLEELVYRTWCEFFAVPEVDPNRNFFELGATSFDIVQLAQRLSAALDRPVSHTVFYHHPTLTALARWLTDPEAPTRADRSEARSSGKALLKRRLDRS